MRTSGAWAGDSALGERSAYDALVALVSDDATDPPTAVTTRKPVHSSLMARQRG